MKINFTLFFLLLFLAGNGQFLTWSPAFIQESSAPIEITFDANKGNQGLLNQTPATDVYVHTAVITNLSSGASDWKYNKFAWGVANPAAQCTYLGNNKWKYTITGGLRAFYGLTNAAEKIVKIAILFRSGAGDRVQRNADGSDMFIPVYEAGLNIRLDEPFREPKYTPTLEAINKTLGDVVTINAKSSEAATLKLYLNGAQVGATAANATTLTANPAINTYGNQMIVAEAANATSIKYDTINFFVTPAVTTAPLPAGVRDGINYEAGDTSVTLVLFAPGKTRVGVLGDFNNWTETTQHQLNKTPDGNRFWIRLTSLASGVEYGYQYLIDGNLKVADYMTEKVLDPSNDQFIPAANYPNLKPYPTGKTTGIVSILQTGKSSYNWQVQNFNKPDKRNLIIYEMLVRDFVATQNWQTVKDSIGYLKRLGVNAIEVMPFNEFEGNNSWGYNPTFFFAPDKMYGTENALRQFIDECHKQGIAVIMDIVMNHTTGLAPTAQMYWNSALNRPAANSPWYNEGQNHPFNFGPEFNHESPATKELVNRVIEHWLTKYKIDGFRWDLSKGFTQVNTCTTPGCNTDAEINNWGNYDASRVATLKRIYDTIQAVSPNAYSILEHLAVNQEEIVLSDYGMLLWANMNYNYNEATMGWVSNSNFQGGIYTNRSWSQPTMVTYQESHDEERLAYKNIQFGNASGSYNIKNLATALKRNEMATAFWAVQPAPKMIWQFGELGYDYSINQCEDSTINNACRVSPKPIRWNYQADPNRIALFNVYSKLFKLRNVPNFLPTFVTNDVTYNLGSGFKWLKVNSDSLEIMVIGNFDVTPATGTVTFQNGGTWYNYLSGGTRTATGAEETITLQPGEYYVYLNREVNNFITALPLKLISFSGKRTSSNISLAWTTVNELNVKQFEVERSLDGITFDKIGIVAANNRTTQSGYSFNDNNQVAVKTNSKLYYRLKILDVDGQFSYSYIALINAVEKSASINIYPNPVKGSDLFIQLDESLQSEVQVKIEDANGRLFQQYKLAGANNGLIKVDAAKLASGVYILKLKNNKKSITKQFIVQH